MTIDRERDPATEATPAPVTRMQAAGDVPAAPFPVPATCAVPTGSGRPVIRRLTDREVSRAVEDLSEPPPPDDTRRIAEVTTAFEHAGRKTRGSELDAYDGWSVKRRHSATAAALENLVFDVQLGRVVQPDDGDAWVAAIKDRVDPRGPSWLVPGAAPPEEDVSTGEERDAKEFRRLVERGRKVLRSAATKRERRLAEKKRDKDTRQRFTDRYDTTTQGGDGAVTVHTRSKVGSSTYPAYQNTMGPTSIDAEWNFKYERDGNVDRPKPAKEGKTRAFDSHRAMANGDILFEQFRAAGFEPKNLELVSRKTVTNDTTRNAIRLALAESGGEKKLLPGTDPYFAILGTPNCEGVVWMLADHSVALGNAEIAYVSCPAGNQIDIGLTRPLVASPTTEH